MTTNLQVLAAWCAAVPLAGGLVTGLFLAGAAGSPLHCAPMCGGFVLGQVADRMAHLPAGRFCEWRRIRIGLLLPYHLGRLTTYAALGAVAGLGGAAMGRLPYLPAVLLAGAALLFLSLALRRAAPWLPGLRAPPGMPVLIRRVAGRLDPRTTIGTYLLGLVLGLLPCGFIYAALAAAAASHDPLLGAVGMAAFAVGTVPALVIVGIAGQAAGHRWQAALAAVAPVILALNAALLAALAVRSLGA